MMHTSRYPLLHVGDKRRWKVTKDLNGIHIIGNRKNTHGGQGHRVLLEILHD